jgi:hypothetical protein
MNRRRAPDRGCNTSSHRSTTGRSPTAPGSPPSTTSSTAPTSPSKARSTPSGAPSPLKCANTASASAFDKIMGWAPRTTRDRHYIRVATRAMREAILALYDDDPICPEQHQPTPEPAEPERESLPDFLAKEAARLAKLEQQIRLPR